MSFFPELSFLYSTQSFCVYFTVDPFHVYISRVSRLRKAALYLPHSHPMKTYRTEREFGLIVGGVLVLLSAWWIYRGKFVNASYIILPVGSLLILLGLVLPRALVYPNRAWMRLAEGLSYVTTRIILGVIFFLIITPIGVVKRRLGWDPLNRRGKSGGSYWRDYSGRQRDPRHYEKMY